LGSAQVAEEQEAKEPWRDEDEGCDDGKGQQRAK